MMSRPAKIRSCPSDVSRPRSRAITGLFPSRLSNDGMLLSPSHAKNMVKLGGSCSLLIWYQIFARNLYNRMTKKRRVMPVV